LAFKVVHLFNSKPIIGNIIKGIKVNQTVVQIHIQHLFDIPFSIIIYNTKQGNIKSLNQINLNHIKINIPHHNGFQEAFIKV
jgi:hypothetical protein